MKTLSTLGRLIGWMLVLILFPLAVIRLYWGLSENLASALTERLEEVLESLE